MSRDDESFNDSIEDPFTLLVRNLFVNEAQEQPGDEMRSMRIATRAAAAFAKVEQDPLKQATLQTFASEATPLQNDDAVAMRMAVVAVASVLPSTGRVPARGRSRLGLGMPLALSVLLVSSGVFAAGALMVVKVVMPAVSAARARQPQKAILRKLPVPVVVSTPSAVVAPAPDVEVAPPSEAPAEVVQPRVRPVPEAVSASQLFAAANKQRRAGHVAASVALYKRLIEKFKTAPEAGLARLSLADLAVASGHPTQALEHLNSFLKAAQTPALIEEALQRKARVLVAAHRDAEARATWTELRSRFPQSVYRLEADRYLEAKSAPIR